MRQQIRFVHFILPVRVWRKSHPFFGFILLLLLSSFLLSGCQDQAAQSDLTSNPDSITVVMDDNYPPYTFRDTDGNLQGILIDQWALWEKKTGTSVEITGMDWSDALTSMEAGEFDVIDTLFFNKSRAQVYDFSAPYADLDVSIYFSNQFSGIVDADSIKGFPVGVKAGDASIEYLSSHGVQNLIEYSSYETLMNAMSDHEVIVAVIDEPPAEYYLYKFSLQNQINSSEPLYSGQFHRAVLKGNPELLVYVESGFGRISAAEYRVIERKWLGKSHVDDRYFIWLGIAAAAGLLVLLGVVSANRVLSKKVQERTKALRASEMKFRSIVETSAIGISTSDEHGNFLSANPALLKILGYTQKEYLKLSIKTISHPDDIGKNDAYFKEMWEGKRDSYTFEKRDKHKDGHYVWGRVTASLVRNSDGKPQFGMAMFDDITESKNAENLRNAIFKISQAATSTETMDDFYTSIHTTLSELMPVENFFIALFDPDDGLLHFPFVKDQFDPSTTPLKPDKTMTNYVMRQRKPILVSGEDFDVLIEKDEIQLIGARPVEWLGVPLFIDENVIGVMVTQHYNENFRFDKLDVDLFTFVSNQAAQVIEKKRTEDALIRSDADLRALFAAMTDIIMVLDGEGRYREIVGTNTNLLYRPPNQLLGKKLHEVLDKKVADTFLKHIKTTLASGRKTVFEYSLPIQDSLLWFSASISPIDESSVIWVARDITQRKNAEEALRLNEARYRTLFEYSPVSLWEEDFSAVKQFLDDLKAGGITNIRAYFGDHPDELENCTSLIKVIDVNNAALKLVHAASKKELFRNINRVIGHSTGDDIIQEFVNIADGKTQFDIEGENETIDGERIKVNIHWAAGLGYEKTLEKVIVSIEDITPRKKSEERLYYRSGFGEQLTKISTQFINLPQGELDAEITTALHTISELEKVDRCFIVRFDETGRTISIAQEWCSSGIPSIKYAYQKVPIAEMNWPENREIQEPIIMNGIQEIPVKALLGREDANLKNVQSIAVFPMRANQQLIGFVALEAIQDKHVWEPENVLMLQQFANILSNAIERSRLLNELEDRAIRDELTGILNRRGFLEFARIELMRANRFNRPTSILLFDVDQLKHVNDTLGHIVGDEVIQEVVKCSKRNIRQIDLLGRWGGDEFIVLMPETALADAAIVAERLCMDIEEHHYAHDGTQLQITVSVGVAANRSPEDTVDDLFSQADIALYEAKESGKNCVKVSRVDG